MTDWIPTLETYLAEKTCLKDAKTITLPNPPEALKHCIVSRGDIQLQEPKTEGEYAIVKLVIQNPLDKDRPLIISDKIMSKQCKSQHTNRSSSAVTIAVTVTVMLIIFCVITAAFFFFYKKKPAAETDLTEAVEVNSTYGDYYYSDGRRRRNTMEVEEVNVDYRMEEEGWEDAVIMDRNSNYALIN